MLGIIITGFNYFMLNLIASFMIFNEAKWEIILFLLNQKMIPLSSAIVQFLFLFLF